MMECADSIVTHESFLPNTVNGIVNNHDCDPYAAAEQFLDLEVPNYLKKLLTINGYNNATTIARICENDITEIESFAKNTLPTIIEKQDFEQYYWIFHQNVDNFKIVNGHRKLIILIADYFKSRMKTNDSLSTTNKTVKRFSSPVNSHNNLTSQNKSLYDLKEENRHVTKTLKNWIRRKCNDKQWNLYKTKCKKIQLSIKSNANNKLECLIRCFCNTHLKIFQVLKNNQQKQKWILSSFYKHFKAQHLVKFDDQEQGEKSSGKISNYFLKVESPQEILQKFGNQLSLSGGTSSINTKTEKYDRLQVHEASENSLKQKFTTTKKQSGRCKKKKHAKSNNLEDQRLITNFFLF